MNSINPFTGSELRRSLNLVILGITFGMSFFIVVNGVPLAGFTRALGAGDLLYGIVMAMPVIGGILQVFASYFIENTGKRKSIFLIAGFIHRLLWIPVAIIPLVVPPSYNVVRIWAITVLITISSAANSITGVCYFSWMGALVPAEIKGRFFSRRATIYTISSAITGLAIGKLLDHIQGFEGFAIVFISVALLGSMDILCFVWVKDPPMEVPKERIPFSKLFVIPFKNRNYLKYIIFISIWNFALNIAAPFFNVYMLEYLNMSYFTIFMFTQIMSNITTVIFMRYWGKLVDRYGNKPVLTICCCVIVILPLLWMLAFPQNYYIVPVIGLLSGIFWPGFEMTSVNLSIWLAPEKNRSIYIASYTLITSAVGIALAYVCGGFLMEKAFPLLSNLSIYSFMGRELNKFHLLFILSSLMRLIAVRFFITGFKEKNSRTAQDIIKDIRNSAKLSIGG